LGGAGGGGAESQGQAGGARALRGLHVVRSAKPVGVASREGRGGGKGGEEGGGGGGGNSNGGTLTPRRKRKRRKAQLDTGGAQRHGIVAPWAGGRGVWGKPIGCVWVLKDDKSVAGATDAHG